MTYTGVPSWRRPYIYPNDAEPPDWFASEEDAKANSVLNQVNEIFLIDEALYPDGGYVEQTERPLMGSYEQVSLFGARKIANGDWGAFRIKKWHVSGSFDPGWLF